LAKVLQSVFNTMMNLLTSATLVLTSHNETHLRAGEYPNIHLAKVS